ncbi:hypothetical protein SAMN04487766_103150 [Actinomyces ruminicola]|uniref:Uncharacterized protein n=2 Tax=Actinomyces ruminicola TaxID=332524 RepID=A0A1G9TV50_9ACTO|nr:hypothetical protein SAMN04487766_103150 [Actinomyces ruminicola]
MPMGYMILPLAVVLVAALIVLGLVVAERYPVATWRDRLRELAGVAREKEEHVTVVPQEARLEDLMTRDDSAVYVGTESFSGLVDVVEKAMDTAESKASEVRRSKAAAQARRAQAAAAQH